MPMRPIFVRHSLLRFKAFLLILCSCLLMLADAKLNFVHRWRQNSAVVLMPLQWASNLPERFGLWFYQSIQGSQKLLIQNAELRAQNLLLQAKTHQLLKLVKDNKDLRSLLVSSLQLKKHKYLVGRIIAVDPQTPRQQVIANEGGLQHVYVGQPVIDQGGVIGQVIGLTALTSRIMLLTDPESAIPVQDDRSHIRAIARGVLMQSNLVLRNIPVGADIKIGDYFSASGLGLLYPAGYPVAKVVAIDSSAAKQTTEVWLQPQSGLTKVRQVLFIWPESPKIVIMAHKQLHNSLAVN